MYAVFCNVLPILVDIWTKSSLQPKHEFILHVYSPQKLAENSSMDNYAYPVTSHKKWKRINHSSIPENKRFFFSTEEWVAGLMDKWINRCCTYQGKMDRRIEGWTDWLPDEWMYCWMDGCTYGSHSVPLFSVWLWECVFVCLAVCQSITLSMYVYPSLYDSRNTFLVIKRPWWSLDD